jgi:hypothetical protein
LIRDGHRFADKDMRRCVKLEHVPILQERDVLWRRDGAETACPASDRIRRRIALGGRNPTHSSGHFDQTLKLSAQSYGLVPRLAMRRVPCDGDERIGLC